MARASADVPFVEDIFGWWECIKAKVKSISITHSKTVKWEQRQAETQLRHSLEQELQKIDQDPQYPIEEYIHIKEHLDKLERDRCRGAGIRSRAKCLAEGERCTAYFLGQEKQKQENMYIQQLVGKARSITTDLLDILQETHTFYRDLFQSDNIPQQNIDSLLSIIDKGLSEEDKEFCDGPLAVQEILATVEGLNTDKSSGSDGLTGEFYRSFKDQLAPILLELFNHIEKTQDTPSSFALGVITLLFKKRGDRTHLENYRPISLLSTDYKILTKVLANRPKTVISSIIGFNQTYSIPDRDISDTVNTIRHAGHYVTTRGGSC